VCRGPGEPLTIEEIVVDPPKVYEVRVKIICTSLCHTDITFWRTEASILMADTKLSSQNFNPGVR
jgi:S-(hydroxymethyl)glutathione dehydrogenase/alcohol dehydrogenase